MEDMRYHVVKIPNGLKVASKDEIVTTSKDKCVLLLNQEGQELLRESRVSKTFKFPDGTRISSLTTGKIYTVIAV